MKKLVLFAVVALLASPVFAQKPVRFIISEDISYDDNIYLKPNGSNDKKDSFISSTRVGADYKALIPGSSLELTAAAMAGYNVYTEKPSKNNYWDTLGRVQLANENLKLGDQLIYTSDPVNSALTERKKRLTNNAFVSYTTSREKMFGVGVMAEDTFTRYMEGDMAFLNRNRLDLGARLYYNMSPKTNFFAEYMFSDINYQKENTSESINNTLGLGVMGHLAPKVTGTAKVTYAMRDYSHDFNNARNYNDLVGYLAQLEWKPTTSNVIRLAGERRMEETLYGDNRYFVDTIISLYGSQKLTNRLTASLTLTWEDMDYKYANAQGTKRNDDVYSVRPQIDYMFKTWLMAGVWYQYRTRSSNVKDAEYDSNKAGIFARAFF